MKTERKIFNFESKILRDETFEEFGYYPEKYGESSAKFVMAVCRYCGKHMKIRKGFFKKSGSACHKECRIEEMKNQKSPFSDVKVREKAQKAIEEKYGKDRKEIGEKISKTKRTQESKERYKKTCLDRYGVENTFQLEEVKEKIKKSNFDKYGFFHPMQNPEILNKKNQTSLDSHGEDNPAKIKKFLKKRMESFSKTVENDSSGKYILINVLRSEAFWKEVESGKSLNEICDFFNLRYESVAPTLSREEFKNNFRSKYSYPRNQKQNSIRDKIQELGFEVISNDREVIKPLEVDIFIPEKKFGIEFHGSYWHSESCLEPRTARMYHRKKLDICREKNIRLFQIFEKHWEDREVQIMNFIKTILGCNKEKIAARKCKLMHHKCPSFIDANHIQGKGALTQKYFNLVYGGEVVASMTAGKHHRQNIKGNPIVLSRLCFKDGVNVQGGSSKLFKYFKDWSKDKGYSHILSWSHNDITEGNIYKVLGFELEKEYSPDYFYWDSNKDVYLSKQSQKKSNTGCPKEITERNWCYDKGLYRLWDTGKRKWSYKL